MAKGVRITADGWKRLPRIVVARAARMVWRGLPLVESGPWLEQANQVLAQGRDFSLGVINPFKMRQNIRDAMKEIGDIHIDGSKAAMLVCDATAGLAEGLKLAAEALVIAEDQAAISEVSKRMADIRERALSAESVAFEAIQVAIRNPDDKDKVGAAVRTEDLALERYRKKEIARLLETDEYNDDVGIGPSFDPSPAGPLGPLWPAGEPSWYQREGMPAPVVVLAQDFDPKDRRNAEVVTFYDREGDVHAFLNKALAFTTDVLKSEPRRKMPPTPCIYIPQKFIGNDQALILGQLVSAGAVALDDNDLNVPEPPHSPEAFAHAVKLLHRSIGRKPLRPFDNQMAGFAPANLPPLPPLSDKQWTRAPSASYESVVQRSSGETTGGWPTAD